MINNIPYKDDILVLNDDMVGSTHHTYYKGTAFQVIDVVDHRIDPIGINDVGFSISVKMITPLKNCDKMITEYYNNLVSFNQSELEIFEYAIQLWNESPQNFIKIPVSYHPDGYNHVCTGHTIPQSEQTIYDFFPDSIKTYMYKRIDGIVCNSVMVFGNEWFDKRCFEYCRLGTLNELKILSVLDQKTKQMLYDNLCQEQKYYFETIHEINTLFTNLE